MSEILNFLKRIQLGIAGLQNTILHHHTRHEAGGSDEIATETGVHHTTHEKAGADEINVAGLSGELADQQRPKVHAISHRKGETDDLESSLKLANFNEKNHSSLAGVTSDQHHNRGNLIESFTAGEDLNANEGVYLSAANTVSKATNANATKAIGVTIEAATSGNPVDVCIGGKATAIANEAISVGDILTPSGVAGRLAILTTNTNSTGTHTHTQGVTGSGGSHVHAQGVTGSGGSHSHTQGATGSGGNHYHTQGRTHEQYINHRHSIGTSSVATGAGSTHSHLHYPATGATEGPSPTDPASYEIHTHVVITQSTATRSESSHTHNYDKVSSQSGYTNPSHDHLNPDTSTTGSHTHSNPSTSGAASHTHTNPNTESGGSHTHTNPSTESGGSHDHTTNIGKVLAKAITPASNPGDTFSIIVCLGA